MSYGPKFKLLNILLIKNTRIIGGIRNVKIRNFTIEGFGMLRSVILL